MSNTNTLVEVRPLPIKRWHGKSGAESIAKSKIIEALPDKSLRYQVDLTDEELDKYGKILRQDLSLQYLTNPDVTAPPSFWTTKIARVTLENSTQFFDKSIPIDYIRLAIIRKSKDVAKSLKEWEDGLAPDATHYIVDEEQEVRDHIVKKNFKKDVQAKIDALSTEEKADIIFLITGKNVKRNSVDLIQYTIDSLIDTNLTELDLHLKEDKERLRVTSLVKECVAKNVLMKDGLKYKYQGSVVGNTLDETIDYLLDVENQSFKLDLMEKVEL